MKRFFLILTFTIFASPVVQACEPYGVLDLQSDNQHFSMHFGPKGKMSVQIGALGGELVNQDALWKCENGVLTVYRTDKRSIIKRIPMMVIAGSITIQNRLGHDELYLFEPSYR